LKRLLNKTYDCRDTAYSNSFFFLKSGTGNLAVERFPSNVTSLFENKDSLLYTMHYRRMDPNVFNFEMWKNPEPINIDSFFKNSAKLKKLM